MKNLELTKTHRGGGNSTTFAGRPEGKKVRELIHVDKLDEDGETYKLVVPNDTTSFNTSFFLGLFYDSIVKLGSIENFKSKYILTFECIEDEEVRECLLDDIIDGYKRANNELNGITGLRR